MPALLEQATPVPDFFLGISVFVSEFVSQLHGRERENIGGAGGVEGQKESVEMLVLSTEREHGNGIRRMEDGMYDVIVEDVQSVWSM